MPVKEKALIQNWGALHNFFVKAFEIRQSLVFHVDLTKNNQIFFSKKIKVVVFFYWHRLRNARRFPIRVVLSKNKYQIWNCDRPNKLYHIRCSCLFQSFSRCRQSEANTFLNHIIIFIRIILKHELKK